MEVATTNRKLGMKIFMLLTMQFPRAFSADILQIYYKRRRVTVSLSATPPDLINHSAAARSSYLFREAVLFLYMKVVTLRVASKNRGLVGAVYPSRQKQAS